MKKVTAYLSHTGALFHSLEEARYDEFNAIWETYLQYHHVEMGRDDLRTFLEDNREMLKEYLK